MRDLKTHVIPHLAQNWRDLGWQLLEDEHASQVIGQIAGNRGYQAQEVQHKAELLFSRWLDFEYETCTWDQIIKSLRTIQLNALVNELRGMLSGKSPGS